MMLTRRQFLQRASALAALLGMAHSHEAATSASLAALICGATLGVLPEAALLGRLFKTAEVRAKPQPSAKVVKQLPAQSLQPILGVSADGWWYQLADGYLPRQAMQPILPYVPPPQPCALCKGYYEVIAPSTTLRDACTPYARINGSYPFGTVFYVHDWLIDDKHQAWYALTKTADGSGLLSWANALHFRLWLPQPSPLKEPTLWLDGPQQMLSLYDGEAFIGSTAIHAAPLPRGSAKLQLGLPCTSAAEAPYLHLWQMLLYLPLGKPVPLYGANWHNHFGTPSASRAVELPVLAARHLYTLLSGTGLTEFPVVIT
ncbi:MAG: twin-arginine translocation signal domain-containing protein [Chloroflexota bacterium]|nr:MAG: twin-arginine translocation signal domain-containing protein [Chloroflexota bacterium]